jgi:hypothetical protein
VMQYRCRIMLAIMLSNHNDDDVVEVTEPMSSHIDNDATEMTYHDVM